MIAGSAAAGPPARPFGFNVVGYITADLGNGVLARNLLRLLRERGEPFAGFDFSARHRRDDHALAFGDCLVASPAELPYAINLFVLPPVVVIGSARHNAGLRNLLLRRDALNANVPMWELPVLPPQWARAMEIFDVIVAASEFIRATMDFHVRRTLTLSARLPLAVPEGVSAARDRFGLPAGAVLFVFSFDPESDPARKNPFAVIDAFERAFAGSPGAATLVVKLNNTRAGGAAHPVVAELERRCAGISGIRMIDADLDYAGVLSLFASCDVYVSLHRSEGLGLGMMEAMALGKPVIATAWSGNMSFMDHRCACLVGYELVPVNATHPLYRRKQVGKGAVWAEPNVDEAAGWMRLLADDARFRVAMGEAAGRSMAAYQAQARQGSFIDEIRAIWERQVGVADGRGKKSGEFQQAWLASLREPALRRALHATRRLLDRHLLWRFR